jgi:hypothetical protein
MHGKVYVNNIHMVRVSNRYSTWNFYGWQLARPSNFLFKKIHDNVHNTRVGPENQPSFSNYISQK